MSEHAPQPRRRIKQSVMQAVERRTSTQEERQHKMQLRCDRLAYLRATSTSIRFHLYSVEPGPANHAEMQRAWRALWPLRSVGRRGVARLRPEELVALVNGEAQDHPGHGAVWAELECAAQPHLSRLGAGELALLARGFAAAKTPPRALLRYVACRLVTEASWCSLQELAAAVHGFGLCGFRDERLLAACCAALPALLQEFPGSSATPESWAPAVVELCKGLAALRWADEAVMRHVSRVVACSLSSNKAPEQPSRQVPSTGSSGAWAMNLFRVPDLEPEEEHETVAASEALREADIADICLSFAALGVRSPGLCAAVLEDVTASAEGGGALRRRLSTTAAAGLHGAGRRRWLCPRELGRAAEALAHLGIVDVALTARWVAALRVELRNDAARWRPEDILEAARTAQALGAFQRDIQGAFGRLLLRALRLRPAAVAAPLEESAPRRLLWATSPPPPPRSGGAADAEAIAANEAEVAWPTGLAVGAEAMPLPQHWRCSSAGLSAAPTATALPAALLAALPVSAAPNLPPTTLPPALPLGSVHAPTCAEALVVGLRSLSAMSCVHEAVYAAVAHAAKRVCDIGQGGANTATSSGKLLLPLLLLSCAAPLPPQAQVLQAADLLACLERESARNTVAVGGSPRMSLADLLDIYRCSSLLSLRANVTHTAEPFSHRCPRLAWSLQRRLEGLLGIGDKSQVRSGCRRSFEHLARFAAAAEALRRERPEAVTGEEAGLLVRVHRELRASAARPAWTPASMEDAVFGLQWCAATLPEGAALQAPVARRLQLFVMSRAELLSGAQLARALLCSLRFAKASLARRASARRRGAAAGDLGGAATANAPPLLVVPSLQALLAALQKKVYVQPVEALLRLTEGLLLVRLAASASARSSGRHRNGSRAVGWRAGNPWLRRPSARKVEAAAVRRAIRSAAPPLLERLAATPAALSQADVATLLGISTAAAAAAPRPGGGGGGGAATALAAAAATRRRGGLAVPDVLLPFPAPRVEPPESPWAAPPLSSRRAWSPEPLTMSPAAGAANTAAGAALAASRGGYPQAHAELVQLLPTRARCLLGRCACGSAGVCQRFQRSLRAQLAFRGIVLLPPSLAPPMAPPRE